jgi:hypothetical protein
MHKTAAGEQRKALKKEAQDLNRKAKTVRKAAGMMPVAEEKALTLQAESDKAQAKAEALRLEARLEDLQIWEQEKTKKTKAGAKTYTYFMASWREGKKVKNVYLGSSKKLSRQQALQKARTLKRGALRISSI